MLTQLLVATAALLPAAAPADDPSPPGPITITLSPEQAQRLCDQRIPRILDRIDDLTARINGDAGTVGSVANLEKRAAQARDAGDDAIATELDERADRRGEQVGRLAQLKERVTAFETEHCS
ncbi:hypothetical protein [Pseudonocardia sp.]|uniref:hypothetical protein n=1 Tax=Pseudonocardia sp. TaxID=60912 RepID=UPI003D0E40B0